MRVLVILLALTASAIAQTPSQTALQMGIIINQWAQQIEAQAKVIADLQKENADLKTKVDQKKEEQK